MNAADRELLWEQAEKGCNLIATAERKALSAAIFLYCFLFRRQDV